MNTEIKTTVKNIFKSNAFEAALELTRDLRGEYIAEYGIKSWNALVSYYKKVNTQPEVTLFQAAEPEVKYEEPAPTTAGEEVVEETQPEVVETESSESIEESPVIEEGKEEEKVEYMIYRNLGDRLDWFGHLENSRGLNVGDTAKIIRMNSCGVSDGRVVATTSLTYEQVALFHKCYKEIGKMHKTYSDKLSLTVECLTKIASVFQDASKAPRKASDVVDAILSFQN